MVTRIFLGFLALVVALALAGCVSGVPREEYNAAVSRAEAAETRVADLESREPEVIVETVEVMPPGCTTEGLVAANNLLLRLASAIHIYYGAASENRLLTPAELNQINDLFGGLTMEGLNNRMGNVHKLLSDCGGAID